MILLIRLTTTQLVTALGAVAFLFVQVMILEIREASKERAMTLARVASVEASLAALEAQVIAEDKRMRNFSTYLLERVDGRAPARWYSPGSGR